MNTVQGHILVIEPNDITRRLITGILKAQGHETYEAANASEAQGFLARPLSLLLIDLDVPEAGGEDFLHMLHLRGMHLPVVAMSADMKEAELREKLQISTLSVLEKPVLPDRLLDKITTNVGRKVEDNARAIPPEPPVPPTAPVGVSESAREGFMRRAVDISQEKMEENCGGPFGAVIVRNGKIIAEGWNEVTSTNDPTAHAEMQAIRKAAAVLGNFELSGCEIYASCEPCPMCLSAIYWARLDRVYFGNTRQDAESIGFDDNFIYMELAQPDNKRTIPIRMMLRDEAQIAFREWMKKSDKVGY